MNTPKFYKKKSKIREKYPDILNVSLNSLDELTLSLIEFHPYLQVSSLAIPDIKLFKSIEKEIEEVLNYSDTDLINLRLKEIGIYIHKILFLNNQSLHQENFQNIFYKKSKMILLIDSHSNQKLNQIPFELAYDKVHGKFISLIRPVSRLIQSSERHKIRFKKRKKDQISFLILVDPLNDLKYSYQEGVEVYFFLKKNFDYFFVKIDFLSKKINEIEFIHYLENYDWIHYSGHGDYFLKINQSSLLINNNNFFYGEKFKSPNFRCQFIFLNSCNFSNSILINSNLIQYMLNAGILNIIASSMKILDSPEFIQCLKKFYKNIILNESTFEKSLFKIRNYNYYIQNKHHWVYFYFMDI